MITQPRSEDRTNGHPVCVRQEGSAVVIAMVFTAIFLMVGLALFGLVSGQQRSTELERTDVKSFNVAEAGVDAGMLTLKRAWPRTETMAIDMSDYKDTDYNELLKDSLQDSTEGLWDPQRSDPSEFIQVQLYDNVDADGDDTAVAYPDAPRWDSNSDGLMFVDARSNVNDDRHRIIIQAQRESWGLDFETYAVVAETIDSNGTGFSICIDDVDDVVYYDVNSATGKGINDKRTEVDPAPWDIDFDDLITDAAMMKLLLIAQGAGTYFEDATTASNFLNSVDAPGSIVYVRSSSAVVLSGNNTIGSVDHPVLLVLDTPAGSENGLDIRGTDDFFGIVVVLGNSQLRGTCSIHGSVYCSGILDNRGTGHSGEVYYSDKVRKAINSQYTLAVKLVPNSWEEYTLAE